LAVRSEQNKETGKTQRFVEVNTYLTTYKQSAILFTIATHIRNMIKGVTKGYRYKMHIVKKHFPIEIKIAQGHIQIGRFLGERNVKTVKLLEGVTCQKNEKNAEEIWLDGNDIEKVALTSKIY
jgi:large subunit ribosomal protein L9e